MRLTKKELNKIAREQGFVRDTLEKVYRFKNVLDKGYNLKLDNF